MYIYEEWVGPLGRALGFPIIFPVQGKDGVDLPDQEQGEWQVLYRTDAKTYRTKI